MNICIHTRYEENSRPNKPTDNDSDGDDVRSAKFGNVPDLNLNSQPFVIVSLILSSAHVLSCPVACSVTAGKYCIVVVWDPEAAAAQFRGLHGRGQAPRIPWLYGAVLYGWANHTKVRSAAKANVCMWLTAKGCHIVGLYIVIHASYRVCLTSLS